VDTSSKVIASVFGTRVVVITRDLNVVNDSSLSVTPVSSTCVLVIDDYRAEYTSSVRVARIDGTWVSIVTNNFGKDGSDKSIAGDSSTFVNWRRCSS